jgi:cobalamin biosynthesis Mg chelatase CobN
VWTGRLWYLDIRSRYIDVLGELMADQVAWEKRAVAGKRRAFVLSSDEDGEDEIGVAQELDQDSDGDAAMVE